MTAHNSPKTAKTRKPKTPSIPLLVRAMARDTQGEGYTFDELPTILQMMPEFLRTVAEQRCEDHGVVDAAAIAGRVVSEAMANSPDYAKPRHDAFMAAVGPMEIALADGGRVYGDEYLADLQREHARAGMLVGIAFAHAFLMECGVLGNGGAR